jgi:hypothetical protein
MSISIGERKSAFVSLVATAASLSFNEVENILHDSLETTTSKFRKVVKNNAISLIVSTEAI